MSLGVGVDIGARSATAVAIRKRGGSLALEYCEHYAISELCSQPEPSPARIARKVPRSVSVYASFSSVIKRQGPMPCPASRYQAPLGSIPDSFQSKRSLR